MIFYIPKTQTVTLPSGKKTKLVRGIGEIVPELADSAQANDLGIKPVGEMTDLERCMLGLKPAAVAKP